MNNIGSLSGFEIYKDSNLTILESIQSKYSKSKKKRIQKKFKKLYLKTFMVPSPNFYIFGNKIFCHPVYYEKLNILIKGK